MATVNLSIVAGSDDAQESTGGVVVINGNTNANALDATDEWVGLRYNLAGLGITDLKGATITAASLTVRINGAGTDEPLVTIYGEAADSPAAFTTAASSISSRARTTASVAWSSADLAAIAGQDVQTPSLVTIIQELVNRAGFSNTGALALLIQGGADAARDLEFRFFEHADGAAGAPRLTIDYTPAGGGGTAIAVKARYYAMMGES